MQTLRNVSAYHEPAWHFDAKFVNGQRHVRANVQKAPDHGHFLKMKNSAYHCHYDLVDNKVDAIYLVYKRRKYDFFMHFCPGTMTTHAESINSDLQRGLGRRLRHT